MFIFKSYNFVWFSNKAGNMCLNCYIFFITFYWWGIWTKKVIQVLVRDKETQIPRIVFGVSSFPIKTLACLLDHWKRSRMPSLSQRHRVPMRTPVISPMTLRRKTDFFAEQFYWTSRPLRNSIYMIEFQDICVKTETIDDSMMRMCDSVTCQLHKI